MQSDEKLKYKKREARLQKAPANSFKESADAVNCVTEMSKKTAKNAADQSESMEQLRVGIDEIAHAIQDNSAVSEETSATSEELASHADTLNKMVQKFELQR